MSGAGDAADALYDARDEPDPEARKEIRKEIQIVALLLIAQELEYVANALVRTTEGIDAAIRSLQRETEAE